VLGRPDHIAASPADRAREALLDDATRSNAEIAFAVRSTPQIVKAARAELASYGLLPATPYPRDLEDHADGKWGTIRYAIGEWGTTVRLLVVVVAISGPAYLIVWLTR
jgi:hypothetical protein